METTTMAKAKDANLAAQTDENNLRASGHEGMLGASGDAKPEGEIKQEPETEVNRPDLKVGEARDAVQARQDKLSAANEEGHAKNMAALEALHKDGEIGAPDPKLGREDNGNTPRVHADGSKSWMPPGVAGAAK